MQEEKNNLNQKKILNPCAPDFTFPSNSNFIEWSTPKPKLAPYKPGQEIKKVEVHSTEQCLNHLEDFHIEGRVKEHINYYYPVLFKGLKCQIQFPLMTELFGLYSYKDPKLKKDDQIPDKYSIHLCMDDSTDEIYKFHCLMDYLDMMAKRHINTLKEEDLGFKFNSKEFRSFEFFSPLRQNRKDKSKPLSLRIKVPCHEDVITAQLYNGEELLPQDLNTFQKFVTQFCKVKGIIEVNPIWYGTYTGEYKYGISYKLIALKIERPKVKFE